MKTKSIKLYLSTCLLLVATTASAQFANTKTSASTSTNTRSIDTNGWNRISVSYNPVTMIQDVQGADNLNFTGFSLGYTKGFSISNTLPLFVEAGINGIYASNKEEKSNIETKISLFSLNIPVNLVYKFEIPNSQVSIVPFVGINFKGNIIGKRKYSYTGDLGGASESEFWEYLEKESGIKQEIDMFDKKETGSKDATWNRFGMGWQIGVGLNYNKLYVGVGYGSDFTELCKKTKVATTSITLGYNF